MEDSSPLSTEKKQIEVAEAKKFDVFEVYGSTARSRGVDCMVYRSLIDALNSAGFDLDGLEEGEEVRVVFQRYTQEQLDEVIYED